MHAKALNNSSNHHRYHDNMKDLVNCRVLLINNSQTIHHRFRTDESQALATKVSNSATD